MKKALALLMALLLVLLTVPAMADAPKLEALFAGTPIDVPFDHVGTHCINIDYNGSPYNIVTCGTMTARSFTMLPQLARRVIMSGILTLMVLDSILKRGRQLAAGLVLPL